MAPTENAWISPSARTVWMLTSEDRQLSVITVRKFYPQAAGASADATHAIPAAIKAVTKNGEQLLCIMSRIVSMIPHEGLEMALIADRGTWGRL